MRNNVLKRQNLDCVSAIIELDKKSYLDFLESTTSQIFDLHRIVFSFDNNFRFQNSKSCSDFIRDLPRSYECIESPEKSFRNFAYSLFKYDKKLELIQSRSHIFEKKYFFSQFKRIVKVNCEAYYECK